MGERGVRIAPMTAADRFSLAATHSRDAAYDLVLLAHVLTAAVGLGAVVLAGAYAWALLRSGPGSEAVRRYYRPGVNWAGRVLFLVPVLGVALMGMSHGDWSFSDGWILMGLVLWMGVAVVAEMALWPAERRLQQVVVGGAEGSAAGPDAGRATPPVEVGAGAEPHAGAEREAGRLSGARSEPGSELRSECLRVTGMSAALSLALVGAAVLMVAKP
jgi:uncharacterized membrane protein